ncbi:MAG: hypothetical protein ABL879_06685 [Devosia sp.]
MKLFGPLAKAVALVGLVLGLGVFPALAGQREIDALAAYVGDWRGKGTMSGANTETVVCRMGLKPGNAGKLNYSGRCSVAGSVLSVNGTIAYVDANNRYEAAMTTNVGFSGMATGRLRGDDIVFDLKERNKDSEGNDMSVATSITLSGGAMSVDFKVTFVSTGESIVAKIPFAKS